MAFKKITKLMAGIRVKMKDSDTGEVAVGTVVSVSKTQIVIKWDDLSFLCTHYEDEIHLISPA